MQKTVEDFIAQMAKKEAESKLRYKNEYLKKLGLLEETENIESISEDGMAVVREYADSGTDAYNSENYSEWDSERRERFRYKKVKIEEVNEKISDEEFEAIKSAYEKANAYSTNDVTDAKTSSDDDGMFGNIGSKIKSLAKAVSWIGIIASLIAGVIMMNDMPLGGLLVMALGSLISWVSSFTLYGFGELIQSNMEIAKALKNR